MKLVWSGMGFVVPVLAGLLLIVTMLGLDSHVKDDLWVWGAMALVMAAVTLPLGLFVNSASRRGGRGGGQHHFMYLPLQYWGGLFVVAGIGLVSADLIMGQMDGPAEEAAPCAAIGETLAECTGLPPGGAAMLQSMCEAGSPEGQRACVACVRGASDPCNPSGCMQACRPQ